jgi:hypothetical protein
MLPKAGFGMLERIHGPLIRLTDRAERIEERIIVQSFVDAKPLFDLILTENNQIIYGRRGTGKTHALLYLADRIRNSGQPAIYLDVRDLGSNTSIYNDYSRTLGERATRLVQDILMSTHDQILKLAYDNIDNIHNPQQVTQAIDRFANECARTRVVGASTITESQEESSREGRAARVGAAFTAVFKPEASLQLDKSKETTASIRQDVSGDEIPHISFGALQGALRDLIDKLGIHRLWILVDEWSVIPIDIQPYMADILRRCFFPIPNLTVKFAAIEHRTNFKIPLSKGQYIGIELGADAAADVNLDDFMVFDNDGERSKEFFSSLIFNHLRAIDETLVADYPTSTALRAALFNQMPTFEEFVRAAEGVPRDALHLLGTAAQTSFGQPITTPVVRTSARAWYNRDKAAAISESSHLNDFLGKVITEVIGHRRARAFLVRANTKNALIEELFDARLLHILRKNISSHDSPGIRYHAFKLDYGCYVDLINTSQATKGLLNADDDTYLEVPPDDWRSIRRAILNPNEFEANA